MSSVRFRYEDFVAKAKTMPSHYANDVIRSSTRKGPDLVMSMDAYLAIKSRHTITTATEMPASQHAPGCKTCGKKT